MSRLSFVDSGVQGFKGGIDGEPRPPKCWSDESSSAPIWVLETGTV